MPGRYDKNVQLNAALRSGYTAQADSIRAERDAANEKVRRSAAAKKAAKKRTAKKTAKKA